MPQLQFKITSALSSRIDKLRAKQKPKIVKSEYYQFLIEKGVESEEREVKK